MHTLLRVLVNDRVERLVSLSVCRTQVLTIISVIWVVPVLVFFTSIIGWQYFVGKRSVPAGMCYVQYLGLPAQRRRSW